ncbi:hypothetical protein GCM10008955_23080 [Deinococcus malanensis]|uniref:Uncharacterized protein n=1 Tax=Deinococcus malanensis TaxID=1706855 RepID=A0ABQ2EWS3_9DEIO|nr:hypothetical protein [Deinococcus malanensis]GGK28736.1 hypothetical protein GCM10008955_23080 [Deinococcus malanensis]
MKSSRFGKGSSKLSKFMVLAPVALEVLSLIRQQQRKTGKYVKARKRDKAVDFLLGQAQRKLGGKPSRRRWF